MKLRIPPSGPIVEANLGTGLRLRLAEGRISVTGDVQAIPTTPAAIGATLGAEPALEVGFLTGTSPNYLYRSTLVADVRNTSNAEATIQLDVFADFTGGGFNSVSKSTHKIEAATACQIRVDAPIFAPPTNATQARFRYYISNTLDGTHVLLDSPSTGPCIDAQVEELLAHS